MKNKLTATVRRIRDNEAIIVLDGKGQLMVLYTLQGGKLLQIKYKNRKQFVQTIYLEDLTATFK
jgi:hypothetical protein